jgi:CHAT domain-containing protein/predicted negative regulator of RcsB-dependent stress response
LVAQAQTPFEQGSIAYGEGEFHFAIQYWEQALSLAETPEQQAIIWGNLASAYLAVGQYQKALNANQTALSLFTELRQEDAIGLVQTNLGNVYEALGDYDRAIVAYTESLRIAQKSSAHEAEAREAEGIILGNLGYIYFLQGDQDKARQNYNQSLNIAKETGNIEGKIYQLLNIGLTHHADNNIPLAKKNYQDSLDLAIAINKKELIARALGNLGMAEADEGSYETAISNYNESLDILETLDNPEPIARTLNNLGHTLLAANRLDESEAKLRESIFNLNALLQDDLGDSTSVALFDTQIYSYNLLQQVLIAKNEPAKTIEALEISEAGRGRAFTKLLNQRFVTPSEQSTANEAANLPIAINAMRKLAIENDLTLVEYSLVPEDNFRVQGRQRGRTAEIYIWVVQPNGSVSFKRSPINTQEHTLENLVQTSRTAIGDRSRATVEVISTNPVDVTQNLKALHQILVEPIQSLLPKDLDEPVVFIPQGDLFLVPFSALINDKNEYLIQHHTILTAPSIQVLALTYQQAETLNTDTPLSPEDVLIIGNPTMPMAWNPETQTMGQLNTLPGAEWEATQVASFFETNALLAGEALEQTVKQRIGSAQIVHLATHGLLEYGVPQDSGVRDIPGAIALAPSQGQDGLLTSAEILDELNLQAQLVVLSACDTGRGDITGDGVVGLSRSLIAAGAPSVVVSLWAVPDAPTADLMVEFYKQLRSGQNKAQSLRQAMLKTMEDHPNPKDWAAFTLVGAAD